MNTITAGDYTVELPIDKDLYRKWVNEVYNLEDKRSDVPIGLSFKRFLVTKVEEMINEDL